MGDLQGSGRGSGGWGGGGDEEFGLPFGLRV